MGKSRGRRGRQRLYFYIIAGHGKESGFYSNYNREGLCSYLKSSKIILAVVVGWIVGNKRRLAVPWGRQAVTGMEKKGQTRIH